MNGDRIVITGIGGFIGKKLASHLRSVGYDVVGIDIKLNGESGITADLRNRGDAVCAFGKLAPYNVVIHLAAVAHEPPRLYGQTCGNVNMQITKNVIDAVGTSKLSLILASSVAVYGEDRQSFPVRITDWTSPVTDYGKSKLLSEHVLRESHIPNWHIMRFCPVFDDFHLQDVSKRVFIPGLPVRMSFVPSVQYTLCNIETIAKEIGIAIKENEGKWTHIIGEPSPIEQRDLVSWFSGPKIPIPLMITKPALCLFRLVPSDLGRRLRSAFIKLFCSNTYIPGKRRDSGRGN